MNLDTLLACMPGLRRDIASGYLPFMETAMREFQITTAPRSWMWLAQVGHESASLRYMEEIASGSAYEGRLDLGNTSPGDGRRFKGRGPIQLTGRANYTRAGQALKLPLVAEPHLAARPQHAFRVSAWWWWQAGLNPISDRLDVIGATRRINGGTNGLRDRQERYARVRALGDRVIPGPVPTQSPTPPLPVRALSVATMPDFRFELFRVGGEKVEHRWNAREGGWVKGWEAL